MKLSFHCQLRGALPFLQSLGVFSSDSQKFSSGCQEYCVLFILLLFFCFFSNLQITVID